MAVVMYDIIRMGSGRTGQSYESVLDTAASRGAKLTTAAADAINNQLLWCSPGTFTTASTLNLSISNTGAVHLMGAGTYATVITGPITPGDGSQLDSLTIYQTELPDLTTDYTDALLTRVRFLDSHGAELLVGMTENGTDGAIIGTVSVRYAAASTVDAYSLAAGELAATSDTHEIRIGDGTTAGGIAMGMPSPGSSTKIAVATGSSPQANGAILGAALAAAKLLTPNNAALSATNRARVIVHGGRWDITSYGNLALDTQFVDLISADGEAATTIVCDATHLILHSVDNVTLKGFSLSCSGSKGAIRWTASNLANIVHEDLEFFPMSAGSPSTSVPCTSIADNVAIFAGTFRRCKTAGIGLYGACAAATATALVSCTATFEDCEAYANSFGSGNDTYVVFSGTMRACRITHGPLMLSVTGTVEDCDLKDVATSGIVLAVRTGAKINRNRLLATGSGGYGLGLDFDTLAATIVAKRNDFATNGIAAGITNSIGTDAQAFNSVNVANA